MDILYVALGLILLVAGGDALVSGAVGVAQRLRLSPLVIGVTLVGFGTSLPELLTSLQAAWRGSPGIALGNVVGSNIANVLLIGGVAATMVAIPVARGTLRRDGVWMLAASLAALALTRLETPGPLLGGALMLGLAAYLLHALRSGERGPELPESAPSVGPNVLRLVLGLGATIGGAALLVEGASALARDAGLSEALIGLTLVAVGTSLPELATSVVAARRGEGALALGNILGSNIFNILGILGATALLAPLPIDPVIAGFDIWVMLAAAVLLVVLARTGRTLARWEGLLLLALYAVYIGWLARGVL
ncbi:calcium/sodium antiporter [Thetidibacter halocola]|uniref:Calcium/sodium antiporter n=1 Tax=Thetidibacter halocola TaxID=2827239 RepID=A0A8J7WBC2_9RHOB|nr:calcium/sodium antiporter [Thetidibacter halocola]MBS0122571.1 calcium/sodium antiporter [Thetidibacter halocola]